MSELAYGGSLENCCVSIPCTGGSNPSLSVKMYKMIVNIHEGVVSANSVANQHADRKIWFVLKNETQV